MPADSSHHARMPATSVVIPFYDNARTLKATVLSILACDPAPDEIILVDDGSADAGSEAVAGMPVRLIACHHRGRAAALNRGIAEAKGAILFFTDADCVVPKDWVQALLKFFEDPALAGVGGNLLPSKWNTVEIAKVLRYVHEFESDRLLEGAYADACLNGNNMALRAGALAEVGGFDETYLHGADADLTRRLLEAGFRLFRTTAVSAAHLKVESLFSFLRTCFMRGSTVRFALGCEPLGLARATRLFVTSPPRNLARDLARIGRLAAVRPGLSRTRCALAALCNLLGAWWNAAGQVHFSKRFARGGK